MKPVERVYGNDAMGRQGSKNKNILEVGVGPCTHAPLGRDKIASRVESETKASGTAKQTRLWCSNRQLN